MYSEEIETLINLTLTDGEFTEKEKNVLLKKAAAAGIDLEEFEIVLQAKLYERQQNKQKSEETQTSDAQGEVIKCPACGAIVASFSTKCAACDTEFRKIEASKTITDFFKKLDELEASRTVGIYTFQTSNVSFGTVMLYLFLWPILVPIKLFNILINKSKPTIWTTIDFRKEEMILNYPVPVSKEEIFEFLMLAQSKINAITYVNALSEQSKYTNAWNNIWYKKMEQISSKASLSMKSDSSSINEVNTIVSGARKTIKNNNSIITHIVITFAILFIGLVYYIRVK